MEFIQTKDILAKATDFHHRLSDYYYEESTRLDEKKLKLLLDYLSRHELSLAELLEQFSEDSAPAIVNTWFKYTPDTLSRVMPIDSHIPDDSTTDDVVKLALEMDDALIQFYSDAADRSMSRDVREMFENLIEQEKSEEHRMARIAFGEF